MKTKLKQLFFVFNQYTNIKIKYDKNIFGDSLTLKKNKFLLKIYAIAKTFSFNCGKRVYDTQQKLK